jgi:hypothetical protein
MHIGLEISLGLNSMHGIPGILKYIYCARHRMIRITPVGSSLNKHPMVLPMELMRRLDINTTALFVHVTHPQSTHPHPPHPDKKYMIWETLNPWPGIEPGTHTKLQLK